MRAQTVVRTAIAGMAALVAATTSLQAFCNSSLETYTLKQCAEDAYFEPVPAPFTPSNVTGVFWQLGFGNATVSTGLGSDGTGFASKAFNGNDSGYFPVDIRNAPVSFPTKGFPPNSVCLGSNDWANTGVDGCCDNPRALGDSRFDVPPGYTNAYSGYGPYLYLSDDNILNPYFGTFQNMSGYPGYYSLASMTDYPTAVLLKLPSDAWFAVAAVTNERRGNNGVTTPSDCSTQTPANPATCDLRQGAYSFAEVTNGSPNAIPTQAGKNNVIPWQQPPVPVADSTLPVDPNDPNSALALDVSWPEVIFHSGGRSVPTNNPTLDARNPAQPDDPNAAPGVGVPDILGKFGLVRYEIQVAADNDVNFNTITQTLTCPGDPNCSSATSALLTVASNECLRIRTRFGTPPRTGSPSTAACRLGQCGDIGYFVTGARLCPGPCFPDPNGEMCNGLDDDCDSLIDEGFNIGQTCNGIGQCGQGTLECQDLTSARCSTEPGGTMDQSVPEICDSLDNDCDAEIDEDFVLGGACTGVGQCAFDPNGMPLDGEVECHSTDPNTTQCSTDPGGSLDRSSTEACDTLDNDCDGATDEIFNLGMACDGVGACGAGTFECDPNAIGAICSTDPGGSADQSVAESCDALDNDCDASTDEDFMVGQTCDGVGECGTGVFECSDPSSSICSTDPNGSADQSAPELCDALDNDCDAETDEDFGLGGACTGTGECGAGLLQCSPSDPNVTICSSDPGGADDASVTEICANALDDDCDGQTDELGASEVCDGNDNNCDGQTDEGFNVGNACTGLGVCGAGTIECSLTNPNLSICSTAPGGSQDGSSTERCDALDNDCDGATDEGFNVGAACDPNTTFGVCKGVGGVRECHPTNPFATICSTMPNGSNDQSRIEICGNNFDDDCDNILDIFEGFNVGQPCNPPGVCGNGAFECDPATDPNATFSVCNTGPGGSADESTVEICDGLDNDCNGMSDDGSAQPCEVFNPVEASMVDCTDPRAVQPRMRWYKQSFDVFRPQIAWDPGFSKKKRIQSFVNLTTDFWEPNGKKWKKACAKAFAENPAAPVLYFRVLRKDLDLPKNDPNRQDTTPVVSAFPAFADLSITKTDGQTMYTPGGMLTYTIVVSNAGPSNVVGARVVDTFPSQLTTVSWDCVPSGGASCQSVGAITLDQLVNIPAGDSVTFTVTAMVDGSATGNIANTVVVLPPAIVADPDTSNNSATDVDGP